MRTCSRPDCADVAAVVLRFDAGRRLAWIDLLRDGGQRGVSDLCARHADAIVLPVGWSLDDRRIDPPTLFPVKGANEVTTRTPSSMAVHDAAAPEVKATPARLPRSKAGRSAAAINERLPLEVDDPVADSPEGDEPAPAEQKPMRSDDLSGLLRAESGLLGRAFNGYPLTKPTRGRRRP
jgi:hypothetical protein